MKQTILITVLYLCAIGTLAAQLVVENISLQKRPPTHEDYNLWDTPRGHSISDDGNWYTFQIYNAYSKEITLTVGSTQSFIKYNLPNGSGHGFS